jgi:hypothetical protein
MKKNLTSQSLHLQVQETANFHRYVQTRTSATDLKHISKAMNAVQSRSRNPLTNNHKVKIMTKKSREEEFWEIFTKEGVTPIECDPNDPKSTEQAAKEIADRISEFLSEESRDKPKT